MSAGMSIRALLAAAALVSVGAPALAGPLTPPPGVPGSTMKSLSEVEPRIAINAENTPGDADSVFKITQGGSYYLTGNVVGVAGKMGIEISLPTTGSVTIDLGGFTVRGTGVSLAGIDISGGSAVRVEIRNGHVRGWSGVGVDLTGAESATIDGVESSQNNGSGFVVDSATIRNCKADTNAAPGFRAGTATMISGSTASGNTGAGFDTGTRCILTDCVAKSNTFNGFDVDSSCTLVNCTAAQNTGYGIITLLGCTLEGCVSSNNTNSGISVNQSGTLIGCVVQENGASGFTGGGNTVYQSCVARLNGGSGFVTSFSQLSECLSVGNTGDGFSLGGITNASKCTATSNTRHGFSGGGAMLIVECSAMYNNEHGISVTLKGNTIRGNLCVGNGQGSTSGAGIHTEDLGHRIEDNMCRENDIGIDVDGTRAIIVGNNCTGNTTNWSIVANNFYGPIIDRSAAATAAVSGNTAASTLATTDPNANFTN